MVCVERQRRVSKMTLRRRASWIPTLRSFAATPAPVRGGRQTAQRLTKRASSGEQGDCGAAPHGHPVSTVAPLPAIVRAHPRRERPSRFLSRESFLSRGAKSPPIRPRRIDPNSGVKNSPAEARAEPRIAPENRVIFRDVRQNPWVNENTNAGACFPCWLSSS